MSQLTVHRASLLRAPSTWGGKSALRQGFTIVELLIVVVVIAILATVTIVSYNGIVHRAELAKVAVSLHQYEQAMAFYQMDHGGYPLARTSGDPVDYVCLGTLTQFPADPAHGFGEGECNYYTEDGGVRYVYNQIDERSEQLFSALSEYMDRLPSDQVPFSEAIDDNLNRHYYDRGFYYNNFNNEQVSIEYDIKSPTCISSTHQQVNYDERTGQSYCRLIFVGE